jgi:carbon-monoxide dehydrogenase medium subunit
MIPAAFDYVRAESADAAIAQLAEHGDEAKLLAGGMSLLPLMKLRLATPTVLIDVGRLRELSYVRDAGDHVAIGALTRHRDVETNDVLERECGVIRTVAGQVGDNQVRHRGTIGGSVAHGEPRSDLAAALLALDATFVAQGPAGEREIPASEFFQGFLETALAPDELLREIRVPKSGPNGFAFEKFNRRAQDFAIVGVVAARTNGATHVGLINMGSTPLRATAVEQALVEGASAADAAARAADGTEPTSDVNASTEYRGHLARVLVRRALEAL